MRSTISSTWQSHRVLHADIRLAFGLQKIWNENYPNMHPTACAHSLQVLVTADLSLNLVWDHKAEHCRTVIRSTARQIIPEVEPVEAIRRPLA
jgi:hypothetical protein